MAREKEERSRREVEKGMDGEQGQGREGKGWERK
jgi:hypothetical protein